MRDTRTRRRDALHRGGLRHRRATIQLRYGRRRAVLDARDVNGGLAARPGRAGTCGRRRSCGACAPGRFTIRPDYGEGTQANLLGEPQADLALRLALRPFQSNYRQSSKASGIRASRKFGVRRCGSSDRSIRGGVRVWVGSTRGRHLCVTRSRWRLQPCRRPRARSTRAADARAVRGRPCRPFRRAVAAADLRDATDFARMLVFARARRDRRLGGHLPAPPGKAAVATFSDEGSGRSPRRSRGGFPSQHCRLRRRLDAPRGACEGGARRDRKARDGGPGAAICYSCRGCSRRARAAAGGRAWSRDLHETAARAFARRRSDAGPAGHRAGNRREPWHLAAVRARDPGAGIEEGGSAPTPSNTHAPCREPGALFDF